MTHTLNYNMTNIFGLFGSNVGLNFVSDFDRNSTDSHAFAAALDAAASFHPKAYHQNDTAQQNKNNIKE